MLRRLGIALASVTVIVMVASCGDDSGSSSPEPASADLAGATVSGDWVVTLTVDEQTPPVLDRNLLLGDEATRAYTLTGGCNVDTVDCHVVRESAAGVANDTWTRSGPTLTFHTEAPVSLPCTIDGKETLVDYSVRATFTLEVTDAQQVGDLWLATELSYARDADVIPGAAAAAEGCPTGSQTESGSAVPATSSSATTGAATTGASATTAASATSGP